MCQGTLRTCARKFSLYCPKYLIHAKSREHFQNLLSKEIHLDGRFVKDVWVHCLRFGTERKLQKSSKGSFGVVLHTTKTSFHKWFLSVNYIGNHSVFFTRIPGRDLSIAVMRNKSFVIRFLFRCSGLFIQHVSWNIFQVTWIKRRFMSDIKLLIFPGM